MDARIRKSVSRLVKRGLFNHGFANTRQIIKEQLENRQIDKKQLNRRLVYVLAVMLVLTSAFAFLNGGVQADTVPSASGKVNASSGAYLRAKTSTDSKAVTILKDNTKLTIYKEVFVKDGSTKATNRWYQVKAGGNTGYIRSDLVDTVSYGEASAKTTDALNYRNGPSSNMTKKGTFKKGASVKVVLNAELKGSSQKWYKVKSGNTCYYVCGDWVDFTSAKASAPAEESADQGDSGKNDSSKTDTAAAAAITPPPVLPEKPVITTSGVTHPVTVIKGMGFGLSGSVICDRPIEKARFGIVGSNGKWYCRYDKKVGSSIFNISSVDADIKFGILPVGTYTYRGFVYINGKSYRVVNYSFNVKKGSGGEKMTATAIQLAWPYGTSKKTYGKKPTAAYKAALNSVYPEHNKWKKKARTGASCDVFVGTVCRYSGIDKNMPRTVGKIWSYLPKHPDKWAKVNYKYKESDLKSGDIIIYYPKKGSKHVCMYIKINGKGYCVEASYTRGLYGFINKNTGKLFKASKMKKLAVYRAIG